MALTPPSSGPSVVAKKSPMDKYGDAMRKAGKDIGAQMGTRPIGGPGATLRKPGRRHGRRGSRK